MIINLISGPRNVSTALMYAFAQRSDTTVKDEPFYGYYLKLTGVIHPGRKRIMNSLSTDIGRITNELLDQNHKDRIIFVKNMAHHHINVDKKFLLASKNVFLIRNPAELLVSFSKVIKDPSLDDIGIRKSWELYRELKEAEVIPAVIDSGELLKDPELMLKKLCGHIGISFDVKMLTWPAGPRKEDGIWAEYWYHNLHKSTGFIKSEPKEVVVPAALESVCTEAAKYYNELFKVSIKYN
ncbi:MAG: sulfotransferase family protein [Cytophagales bacterium]|nr:sulfotransferase family protein [Cytophagales bacterium]